MRQLRPRGPTFIRLIAHFPESAAAVASPAGPAFPNTPVAISPRDGARHRVAMPVLQSQCS